MLVQTGQAAEHKTQTASTPSEILIHSALMTNIAGMQHYVRIRLIATDNQSLHTNQIYQAVFESAAGGLSDGRYNEAEGVIFIDTLSQADALVHQMTLKRIGFNQFAVIEYITSAVIRQKPKPDIAKTYDAVPSSPPKLNEPPPSLYDDKSSYGYSQ